LETNEIWKEKASHYHHGRYRIECRLERYGKFYPDGVCVYSIHHRILKINAYTKQQRPPNSTYLDKKNKVLKRCIEMCFLLKLDHRIKMLMINVSIDPKQTFEYSFCHRHEILREWNT
jgi:hypothetical protein